MQPNCLSWRDGALSLDAIDLSDNELHDHALQAATAVRRLDLQWLASGATEPDIKRRLRQVAKHHSVEPPDKRELQQLLNRFKDPAWWRRALRKRFRLLEHAAIRSGQVHERASPYVSGKALRRAARDRRRTAELLDAIDVINQTTGEVLPLSELASNSLANPANRRKAMMARIKGIEQHAEARGDVALFFTITCPSRMHARRSTGAANARHDGTGTRTAHAHLNRVWRRAMRKLKHDGVEVCGLRVVEPHHDGCPHWHVLAFTAPAHAESLTETLRAYALGDSPNEPGASKHRFTVVRVDPKQGSAVGYVAKYVAKNMDGEGVGFDADTGATAADSALRSVTWARLWGVRQFQFFGVPSITPTRELYRVEPSSLPSHSGALQAAHDACKANDYGAWLAACHAHAIRFGVDYIERPSSRYGGETSSRICGLTVKASDLPSALQLTTRTDEWRFEPRRSEAVGGEIAAPWTRFNNCAPVDFIEVFSTRPADEWGGHEGASGVAATRPPPRRLATQIARPPC